MNKPYRLVILLKGGQYMSLYAHDDNQLKFTVNMLNDMIRRFFNEKEGNKSAPFINCYIEDSQGIAWVDARELIGYYLVNENVSDLDSEMKKRSISIQERFIKIMEKEVDKGDEWKKKEE